MDFPQESNDKKFSLSRKLLGGFFGFGIGILLFLVIGTIYLHNLDKGIVYVLLLISGIVGGMIGWKCYSSNIISHYAPFIKAGFLSIFLLLVAIVISVLEDGSLYLITGTLVGLACFFLFRKKQYEYWRKSGYFKAYFDRTVEETKVYSRSETLAGISSSIGVLASVIFTAIYGKSDTPILVLLIATFFSAVAVFLIFSLIGMVVNLHRSNIQ